jgi:hypothetical protein
MTLHDTLDLFRKRVDPFDLFRPKSNMLNPFDLSQHDSFRLKHDSFDLFQSVFIIQQMYTISWTGQASRPIFVYAKS